MHLVYKQDSTTVPEESPKTTSFSSFSALEKAFYSLAVADVGDYLGKFKCYSHIKLCDRDRGVEFMVIHRGAAHRVLVLAENLAYDPMVYAQRIKETFGKLMAGEESK